MAITDWTKPLYGNFTPYVGDAFVDKQSGYVGIKPQYTQGFDWKSGQPLTIGDYTGANPYQYGSAENEYAGLNGLQNTEGWRTFGSGASEYKAYADAQNNGSWVGQLGPDSVEGNAYFSAPQGQHFLGPIMQSDPELWKILQPYANAYGSYEDKYGYTIPEEYYKAGTSALGRWTTKGDWKGPARVISLIASAFGGQLLSNAGLLAEGAGAASSFPTAAGDGFYNWADAVGSGIGGGSGVGAGAGGVGGYDTAAYGINPATGSPYQMPLPMGTNGAPVIPANGMYGNFAINPTTGLPFSMPLPAGAPPTQTSDPSAWVGGEGNATIPTNSAWNPNNIPQDYFQNLLQGGTGVGAEAAAGSASLWDQIKSIYDSPEAQMAKTIASGTQSALNAAQQAGLLGGGQAQASGGGGSAGLLGTQSGGRGRSFAELSPYARGLLRG